MKENSQTCDQDLALALRALGHPVRLDILRILARECSEPCCCTDVTGCLPLAQSTVSQHIKVLLEAGFVERHAKGTRNCYTICLDKLTNFRMKYDAYLSGLTDELAVQSEKIPESSQS